MNTLFQVPERQYNNYQDEFLVDGSMLSYHRVKLVFDVVSLDAGSYCDITLSPIKNDIPMFSKTSRISDTGQYTMQVKYRQDTDISYGIAVNMSGRMRVAIRVVAFDQGEDVPEVI